MKLSCVRQCGCTLFLQKDPFPGDAPIHASKIQKYRRGEKMVMVCTVGEFVDSTSYPLPQNHCSLRLMFQSNCCNVTTQHVILQIFHYGNIIIMAGMAVFLRGWLPHRGKAQMACDYCFPTRTMF